MVIPHWSHLERSFAVKSSDVGSSALLRVRNGETMGFESYSDESAHVFGCMRSSLPNLVGLLLSTRWRWVEQPSYITKYHMTCASKCRLSSSSAGFQRDSLGKVQVFCLTESLAKQRLHTITVTDYLCLNPERQPHTIEHRQLRWE